MNAFLNKFGIVRIAEDQRFVVLKKYGRLIFGQIVAVAHLKKQLSELLYRKMCS